MHKKIKRGDIVYFRRLRRIKSFYALVTSIDSDGYPFIVKLSKKNAMKFPKNIDNCPCSYALLSFDKYGFLIGFKELGIRLTIIKRNTLQEKKIK